eukprot:TRINITY_DN16063_c0_g3_i1.p2 TRINITY_DN16063_c0_g3~~TRINITY_DN16063_c0_g3_i1.p2  ORF type:complete len:895 (+),score=126.75 TRINITY_DN16063_c0_g3_i1:1003-3687(+)
MNSSNKTCSLLRKTLVNPLEGTTDSPSFSFPKSPPVPTEMTRPFNFSLPEKPLATIHEPAKNALGEAINRKGQAKRLKEEMEDCLAKLQKSNFVKELKQDSYKVITEKVDKYFEDYSGSLSSQMTKIRNLIASLEEADKNPTGSQIIMQCESEYKKTLDKLKPPVLDVVKKDEFIALKTELNTLKRDKLMARSAPQIDQNSNIDQYIAQLAEKNATIEQLQDMISAVNVAPDMEKLQNMTKRIAEQVKELNAYAVADPLADLKGELLQDNDKPQSDNVENELVKIEENLKKGIEGIKVTLKARKDMHEKLMNQLMVSSTSDIFQLNSKHMENMEAYKEREEKLMQRSSDLETEIAMLKKKTKEHVQAINEQAKIIRELKEKIKEGEEKISTLELIEKEKQLADETIKRLEDNINTLNLNIKERLEVDNKSLRAEIERITKENRLLQRYKDDFNGMEKEKFAEMEAKHKRDIEVIRGMHKEQLEKQRLVMEKTIRESADKVHEIETECNSRILSLKSECEGKIQQAKELAKKEEESARAEYVEKFTQLKSHEHALFLRNVNLLLNKLSRDVDSLANDQKAKHVIRKSRCGNEENESRQVASEPLINTLKGTIENLKKVCRPLHSTNGLGLANTILSPIGDTPKPLQGSLSTENLGFVLESPHLPLKPKELFKIVESAKASESESDDSTIVNMDQRKCIRCHRNDFTCPGHCQFHPFQALGTSNFPCFAHLTILEEFIYTEQWEKCKEGCSKNKFSQPGCYVMPTHLYAVKPRAKSTTRRAEAVAEEPQMTSRFGGSNERYQGNDTTIIIQKRGGAENKLNKTAGDIKLRSLNESRDYYQNKQKLKESIKGIKERIGMITGKKAVSPTSSGSRVLYSDESLSNLNVQISHTIIQRQ